MQLSRIFIFSFLLFGTMAACHRKNTPPAVAPKSQFKNVLIAGGKRGDNMGPCEPTICVNPVKTDNIAAGAILDAYYWSDDAGHTWKSGKLASSHGVFGDPVLIADTKGDFYYAHLSNPEGKGWESPKLLDRMVVQKSVDGGRTYNDGAGIGNNHPKDQDKQWLGLDPATGHLYITWTEFDEYNNKDTANFHTRILFSKSTDGGATWSNSLKINQFDGNCLDDDYTVEGAVPVAGPKGEIYVAWAWNDKIWFDKSLDGGQTWLERDIVAADQPGGWTYDVPGISRCNGLPVLCSDLSNGPNRGALYINWSDQRRGEDDTDIWVVKSTDGGATWGKPVRVNDDKKGSHQFLTWLTIDQSTGYLYCVWYDRRNYLDERTDVYLGVSRDGGRTFENHIVSESPFDPTRFVFFGDYNHISAHNGVVRPIWTRLEKGVLSVWTAIIDMK